MERLFALTLLAATLLTVAAADTTLQAGVDADFYTIVRGPVDNGTVTLSCNSYKVKVVLVNDPRMLSVEVKPVNPTYRGLLPGIVECVIRRVFNESGGVGVETIQPQPAIGEQTTTPVPPSVTGTPAEVTTTMGGSGATSTSWGAPRTSAEKELPQGYNVGERLAIVLLAGLAGSAIMRFLLR